MPTNPNSLFAGMVRHAALLLTFQHDGRGLGAKTGGFFLFMLGAALLSAIAAGAASGSESAITDRVASLVILTAVSALVMWEIIIPAYLVSAAADLLVLPFLAFDVYPVGDHDTFLLGVETWTLCALLWVGFRIGVARARGNK
ncbi:MAG: hypothetical protein KJZ90_00630 [Rhodocyclaceae bacterium]|nr:hypothetical protein [Rhodocyclaceae bacterium]